jgi:hypothetical protein
MTGVGVGKLDRVSFQKIQRSIRSHADGVPAMFTRAQRQQPVGRPVGEAIAVLIGEAPQPAVSHEIKHGAVEAQSLTARLGAREIHRALRPTISVHIQQCADVTRPRDHDAPSRIDRHGPDVRREVGVGKARDAKPARHAQSQRRDWRQVGSLNQQRSTECHTPGKPEQFAKPGGRSRAARVWRLRHAHG